MFCCFLYHIQNNVNIAIITGKSNIITGKSDLITGKDNIGKGNIIVDKIDLIVGKRNMINVRVRICVIHSINAAINIAK
ncbi:hypothetical protein HpSP79_04030 [Helicobacter pylori]